MFAGLLIVLRDADVAGIVPSAGTAQSQMNIPGVRWWPSASDQVSTARAAYVTSPVSQVAWH